MRGECEVREMRDVRSKGTLLGLLKSLPDWLKSLPGWLESLPCWLQSLPSWMEPFGRLFLDGCSLILAGRSLFLAGGNLFPYLFYPATWTRHLGAQMQNIVFPHCTLHHPPRAHEGTASNMCRQDRQCKVCMYKKMGNVEIAVH